MKKIAVVVVIALLALWLSGCQQTGSQEVSDLKAKVAVLETKVSNIEKKIDELTQKIEEMAQTKAGKKSSKKSGGTTGSTKKNLPPLKKK